MASAGRRRTTELQPEYLELGVDALTPENNKKQPAGSIDLHGLYVKEAIEQVEKAVSNGQRSGLAELRIITGKGNHSVNHQAKIKPAVAQLMQK